MEPEKAEQLTIEAQRKKAAEAAQAQRLSDAAVWARDMHRAFKGVRGAPNRRERARIAIYAFNLNVDDDA